MATRSPLTPRIASGAFVRLEEAGIGVVPQVVAFQYNPETLTRKLKPFEPPADKEGEKQDSTARAAPYDPEEELDVAVSLDATDGLDEPATHPQAVLTGVADRIAALERLMYPSTSTGLLTSAVGAIAGKLGFAGDAPVPTTPLVPVVLFAWGPGRVLPVKVTACSVEEQAFNSALYPIRAKVTVGIRVLTAQHFASRPATAATSIALAAYRFTSTQREVLAAVGVVGSVASVIPSVPF